MDWNFLGSTNYVPSVKDLYLPALTAALYWAFKRVGSPAIFRLVNLLKALRYRELKKAKAIRIDALKTHRELKKESALYTCFLLSAVISLGLLILPIPGKPKDTWTQAFFFLIYMSPVFYT